VPGRCLCFCFSGRLRHERNKTAVVEALAPSMRPVQPQHRRLALIPALFLLTPPRIQFQQPFKRGALATSWEAARKFGRLLHGRPSGRCSTHLPVEALKRGGHTRPRRSSIHLVIGHLPRFTERKTRGPSVPHACRRSTQGGRPTTIARRFASLDHIRADGRDGWN